MEVCFTGGRQTNLRHLVFVNSLESQKWHMNGINVFWVFVLNCHVCYKYLLTHTCVVAQMKTSNRFAPLLVCVVCLCELIR